MERLLLSSSLGYHPLLNGIPPPPWVGQVIHEMPVETKKRFLFFSTGSDRVPIKGLGNLNFVISRNGTDEARLPSASTCTYELMLPAYATQALFDEKLDTALDQAAGFYMS